ncbi:hypothetical protein B0H67DRAFT_588671 [Lasiosphaeris hirsuta]|uniref:Heterokaryon incompatibility domain-containing protein n=1 Tax=Lasiosphaeris hirsuta TaxID=260670 RepID=A0AA40A1Z4_9PEZI|nr:hypothetical protein B0H67DRAFT_588671 [Lasiosphaeris hirsuta]
MPPPISKVADNETTFGGEDWSDVWPQDPEPGCLAHLLADFRPTNSEARISGLGHAYISVTANEGICAFALLLLLGAAFGGLSAWLLTHIIVTRQLVFIAALVPAVLLMFYCWGRFCLKYRLRRLLHEIIVFCCLDSVRLSGKILARTAGLVFGTPAWLFSGCFIVKKPGYRCEGAEALAENPRLCSVCKAIAVGSRLLAGSSELFHLTFSTETWPHHSLQDLQRSAPYCPLCSLLFLSTDFTESEAITAEETSDDEKGPTSQENDGHGGDGSHTPMTVKLWGKRSWARRDLQLKAKLQGRGIRVARPLVISEFVDGLEHGNADAMLPGDYQDSDPSDPASTWALAKGWIDSCSCEHKLCQNGFLNECTPAGSFTPPWLLEIPPAQRNMENNERLHTGPTIKIIHSDSIHDYIAFSREWESGEDSVTYPAPTPVSGELRLDDLSLTTRRAIFIAGKLGFRHLWIESLCGKQIEENSDDMSPATLGLIFAHAVCTVSEATAIPGMYSSLPPRRDGCPLLFRPKAPNGSNNGECKKKPAIIAHVSDDVQKGSDRGILELFASCVDSYPPNRQTKSFEERLLSRRLLFVPDNNDVFFECNTLRASRHYPHGVRYTRHSTSNLEDEGFKSSCRGSEIDSLDLAYRYETRKKTVDPEKGVYKFETIVVPVAPDTLPAPAIQDQLEGLRGVPAWRGHRGSFHRLLRFDNETRKRDVWEEEQNDVWADKLALHEAWFDLVGEYSARPSVRCGDNKLTPLMGVASIIARAHGPSVFLGGLWLKQLPLDLLWFRAGPTMESPPAFAADMETSHLPTWSWAHINAEISHALKDKVKIPLAIAAQSAGRLRYAPPAGRFLLRDTRWRDLRITPLIGENVEVRPSSEDADMSSYGNLKIRHLCPLLELKNFGEKSGVEVIFDIEEWQQRYPEVTVFGLPISAVSSPVKGVGTVNAVDYWGEKPKQEVHGVLVTNDASNGYRRVGYFRVEEARVVEGILRSMGHEIENHLWLR